MNRAFRAEVLKLTRPRAVVPAAIVVLAASALAAVLVFQSAEPAATGPSRLPTLEALAASGGGTEVFSTAASFAGFFAFVLFTANWAGEFSQGTFRTLLLKQPLRLSLLAGKMAGLLTFAAGALMLALVTTFGLSLVMAQIQDVPTEAWFSLDGIGAAVGDYATVLVGISAWATFGMTLAVLVRSVPLALAIGIGWAGPFEHITMEAWGAATSWYPGLLLEALAVGGTPDVTYLRAIGMTAGYVALAALATAWSFTRRDVAG